MSLNDKIKEMLDRRAKDMANLREEIINWVKSTLNEKMIESLIVTQIENGRFEFEINFSVSKDAIGCVGVWRETNRELTGEQKHELAHAISEEIAKIIKEHGFSIVGIPIFEHRGTQHGRVCFKCKEEEQE